jgi:hypothetical protein
VPVAASLTLRAQQQVNNLRTRDRRAYDQFLTALRARGCEALGYRLAGEGLLERLCVVHLIGRLRVVVAFESAAAATVLLVGPHADDDPFLDVYSQLYALAGLDSPPTAQRRKPPCCEGEDRSPPILNTEVLDDLVRRARELSGADRRRAQRAGRR